MLRLYDFHESGNAYKVRLLLSQLGENFERIDIDILDGATHTPEFLAKNPNHRIPLLELPDGRTLAESNAILHYLARDSALLPEDPWQRAEVLQWQFFEQYSHEPYIAVVRFWHFAGKIAENEALLSSKVASGYQALDVMEQHLSTHDYFAADRYTIADISLYAYTHVAEEGKFDLGSYPAINAWLQRVAAQPGHINIEDSVGQAADWP